MTNPTNDSVALSQVLSAQTGGRLSLSTALYACSELARLVATEHEMNRTATGLDVDHVRCTRSGGVVLGGTRVHHPDLKADVHAVGTIFYRLLTGKAPAARDVVAPSHFNPGVDSELDAVILASLARDSSQRPASVRVLEGALTAVFEELELTPSGDELAGLVRKLPRPVAAAPKPNPVVPRAVAGRKPVFVKPQHAPPKGWYAMETIDEDGDQDDGEEQTASQVVPTWQEQEDERKWKVATAIVVAVALLWVLWPQSKPGQASSEEPAAITRTARR